MNIPNRLTLARFLIIPFILIALYLQTKEGAYLAFVLLAVAWLTDIFDGHIAKKKKMVTKHGAYFDPFVDKVLVTFAFIVLGDLKIVPMWLVILMLLRDFLIQAIRNIALAKGVVLASEWSGKIKFGLQMLTLLLATLLIALSYSYGSIRSWMFAAIFWVMAFVTAESYYALFDFLFKNKKKLKLGFL